MYLKRIELTGFKSFPNKTKISFEPGVCCIVGPNGSGKSNVADALRWVLGEQSARNIRGGKLEDVIFSGSNKRRPLGMAEVSVILDNSDNYLPLPFSEISVTRRAVRNGSSEYLINDQPCRLKDIRDLFVDTGVGAEGLSLINQGRINELISARPEERRALVEEAAGIIKYRDRKREALRKLDETERHLERIGDVVHELDGRIGPLSNQAQRAEAFLRLREESQQLEIGVSVKVLSEAADKLAELDAKLALQEKGLMAEESARLELAAEAEQLRLALAALDEEVRQANESFYLLQTQREKAEGERLLALSQQEHSESTRQRLQRELAAGEQALAEKKRQAEELTAHIRRTESELQLQQEQVCGSENGGEDLAQRAAILSREQEELSRDLAELAVERTAARERSQFKQELQDKNSQALERLEQERTELTAQRREAEAASQALGAELEEIQRQSQAQSAGVNENEVQLRQLNLATQELSAAEADCRFRCHSLETRVSMLQEMAAGYEGFFPGVKGLMAAKSRGQAPAGVIGVIAELMEVPPEYRVAVEAYLGANIQNIVCRDAASAQAAVGYLKRNKLGRATFLPLDILKLRDGAELGRVSQLRGVHGRASQLVQVEDRLRPAVDFLLNNVVIVDDMDAALAAARELHYRASVVTLDGDMVNPGASISGGSRGHKAGELLGQKSRLEEAKGQLAAAREELRGHSDRLAANRAAVDEITAANDRFRQQLGSLSEQRARLVAEGEQQSFRRSSVEQRLLALEREQARLRGELNALAAESDQAEAESQRLEQREKELQARLDAAELDLAAIQEQVNLSREEMTEQRVALAASEQKLRGQRISLGNLNSALTDLSWEAEEKSADLAAAEAELTACAATIAQAEQRLTELGLQLHIAGEALEQQRHGMAAESARLLELDKAEKERLRGQEKFRSEIHSLQLRRERWQADFENESIQLRDKYQLDLEQARALVGETAARTVMISRLNQLKREISALGNINLDAIDEYREVSERHSFLTSQREDMLVARSRLDTVIREMDTIMASRFREAFTLLSAAFDRSFRRLFDGGGASLFLSDPDFILETGVEIRVNPPGKKVANYNLLSGGEKALVGIALMFAMLEVRPTPFCVMDEVDAALDEANIDRFTAYIADQAANCQFVMISHRQNTMDAASLLWGVTMEEEGVSKVISVRLSSAV